MHRRDRRVRQRHTLFIQLYLDQRPLADLNHNGVLNFFDVSTLLTAFADGCP